MALGLILMLINVKTLDQSFISHFYTAMIDKWSKIHIFVVVSIALAQVYIFRDMFSSGEKKLQRHRMGAHT